MHMLRSPGTLTGCRHVLAFVALTFFVGQVPAGDTLTRRTPIVVAVEKTKNSIVTIKVPRPGTRDTVGTGVIVDENGYVVTNRHVVGSSGSVHVVLADGRSGTADVLAAESALDLAILKLNDCGTCQAVTLGPVSDLMVGETVIAIGHPFGYTNTVSTGIISALNREITMPTGDVLKGLIQTDASINPGNSGGPLLNVNGEMIGINVALRDGAQGIAFAINAGTVKRLLHKHLNAARVSGIHHGLDLRERVLGETGERQRVVVAAEAADLKLGDEILAVGIRPINIAFDIERALWHKRPGDKITLKVARNGHELSVDWMLGSEQPATRLGVGQTEERTGESHAGQPTAQRGIPTGIRP